MTPLVYWGDYSLLGGLQLHQGLYFTVIAVRNTRESCTSDYWPRSAFDHQWAMSARAGITLWLSDSLEA